MIDIKIVKVGAVNNVGYRNFKKEAEISKKEKEADENEGSFKELLSKIMAKPS